MAECTWRVHRTTAAVKRGRECEVGDEVGGRLPVGLEAMERVWVLL